MATTAAEVMKQLEKLGSEQTKKTLMRHGSVEPLFGVKIGDMKPLQKKIKKDHALSLELYSTGNADAMYFAGLIADENSITAKDLQRWVSEARSQVVAEYTVPWIAAESKHGWELGSKWINSKEERIASAGWSTLSSVMSLRPDSELDITALKRLLDRVAKEIHTAPNRVAYTMNGFIISAGCYVSELTEYAKAVARKVGVVTVNVGDTACKIPSAEPYIEKVEGMGRVGKKKKMARC